MSGKDGGWILPDPIDPPGRRGVCICLPDEINHIMAFWGNLQNLGYWFNWQRDPDHKAVEVSNLWNQIIKEAHEKWIEGTMCTTCTELIACLEPYLTSLQEGIDAIRYGAGNPPTGQPLSPSKQAQNQAGTSNPECSKDVLWAQCIQLVQYTNQLVVDALEAAEVATNTSELVDVIANFPGLDEAGADVITGYIQFLQEGIQENYVAQYDQPIENEIACAIFCACQADCQITIERVCDVYNALVGQFFADFPTSWTTLAQFLSYFGDGNIGSDVVVYALQYMIWAGGQLANIFLGDVGTLAIQTILALAVNDANSDWAILCEDCPAEADFWLELDATVADGGVYWYSSHAGAYYPGEGLGQGTPDPAYASYPTFDWTDAVTLLEAEFRFSRIPAGSAGFWDMYVWNDDVATQYDYTFNNAAQAGKVVYHNFGAGVTATKYNPRVNMTPYGSDVTQIRIDRVRLHIRSLGVPTFLTENGWHSYAP